MKRNAMRSAVAVAALAAVALLGGCGSDSDAEDVSGAWEGSLSLRLAGAGTLAGDVTLQLAQSDGFASGRAVWAPIGDTQSIAGPIEGVAVTLRLVFRCNKTFETAQLEGTVNGDSIEIDSASGMACRLNGLPRAVEEGSASLTRTSDGAPL